jgi:restriction endonuclease-like protein
MGIRTAQPQAMQPPEVRASDPEALANLYPEAAAYVSKHWESGRLEARSRSPRSSQALCVSVLITLRQRPPGRRAAICAAICREAGLALPAQPPPDIDAELREHRALLGEIGGGTPTALDGLLTSTRALLTIESKFTEREFGSCGQVKATKVKPPDPRFDHEHPNARFANCTGIHGVGSDQKPTTRAKNAPCRLTVQDGKRSPRRYWDVAPDLFLPSVLTTPQPCPFSTDSYQLMRNVAFAQAWADKHRLTWFGFLVTLVDAAPKTSQLRARIASFKRLLKPDVRDRVGILSYEQLADVLDRHDEGDLGSWVWTRLAVALPDCIEQPLEESG